LLQGPQFGPGDLAEIGTALDAEEQALFSGEEAQPYNVDSSADGGNFSIQVLSVALGKFKLELIPGKHPSVKELMKDPPKAAAAFLCQHKDHWFAVREAAGCWWNLNSTRQRPGLVSPFYLAAWLAQLSAEGHSIFLVRGAKLPEPAKPREEKTATEENFHELNDLLDKAKDPNDRPLQGGESAEVAFPTEDCWNDTGWQPAVSSTAIPGGQAWDGFGGYGESDSVIESQRRLLEQSTRRTASGAPVSGGQSSAVETQRRLLEEAQRGTAAKAKSQAVSGPGINPQGGGVLEQQRRLLEEANRRAIAQPQASAQFAPGANPANRVLEEQKRLLEEASRRGGQEQAGRPPQRLSTSGTALNFQALKEMGFKEPQIQAAEALTSGSKSVMTDMLLRVRGVPADTERSGEKLAEVLQGAVLGLDRADLSGEAILHLVTVLCLPEARLHAASVHFDPTVLTEFLLATLSKRGERWPPEIVGAVTVVVDLLATIPRPGSVRHNAGDQLNQRGGSRAIHKPSGDSGLSPKPVDIDDAVTYSL
jgi:hypothetical protein